MPSPDEKLVEQNAWLHRRVKALEQLLVCYRIGKQPSEKLFAELERTKKHTQAADGEPTDA